MSRLVVLLAPSSVFALFMIYAATRYSNGEDYDDWGSQFETAVFYNHPGAFCETDPQYRMGQLGWGGTSYCDYECYCPDNTFCLKTDAQQSGYPPCVKCSHLGGYTNGELTCDNLLTYASDVNPGDKPYPDAPPDILARMVEVLESNSQDNWNPSSGLAMVNRGETAYWLNECEGDCDSDDDCNGDHLRCFQRDGHKDVPGCSPGGYGDVADYDYCYDYYRWGDGGNDPTPSPTKNPSAFSAAAFAANQKATNLDYTESDVSPFTAASVEDCKYKCEDLKPLPAFYIMIFCVPPMILLNCMLLIKCVSTKRTNLLTCMQRVAKMSITLIMFGLVAGATYSLYDGVQALAGYDESTNSTSSTN